MRSSSSRTTVAAIRLTHTLRAIRSTPKSAGIPYLMSLNLFQRDKDGLYQRGQQTQNKAIEAEISSTSGEFAGKAEVSLVNAASHRRAVHIEKQEQYRPQTVRARPSESNIAVVPAHSFTQIRVKVK